MSYILQKPILQVKFDTVVDPYYFHVEVNQHILRFLVDKINLHIFLLHHLLSRPLQLSFCLLIIILASLSTVAREEMKEDIIGSLFLATMSGKECCRREGERSHLAKPPFIGSEPPSASIIIIDRRRAGEEVIWVFLLVCGSSMRDRGGSATIQPIYPLSTFFRCLRRRRRRRTPTGPPWTRSPTRS